MRHLGRLEERATCASSDEELVAAFRAGLTIEEVVAIYRSSVDDVRALVAEVRRPKPRRVLGLIR
jgi:hypothetical protein